MLRNYLTVALRHFKSNKFTILSCIAGLAIGLACSIIAYLNWEFHDTYDAQHTDAQNIYKVHTLRAIESDTIEFGVWPAVLAEVTDRSIHGVRKIARYMQSVAVVKLDEKVIGQKLASVDPAFMEMFDFPLVTGTPGMLNQEDQVYITQEVATQFYGHEEVAGEFLELVVQNGNNRLVEIAGVLKNHPLNSSFSFDILASYKSYETASELKPNDWSTMAHASFIQADPDAPVVSITKELNTFIDPLNKAREDWQAVSYTMVPLPDLAEQSRSVRENYLGSSNPAGTVMIPAIMAMIILLVACINFMNAMILLSGKRLKEIGVRKAMGGVRRQLIGQMILENFILLIISLLLGIVLAELLLPIYNRLGPWVELKMSLVGNWRLVLFLVTLLVVVGAISAGYPSFYISRFNAMQIFRSKIRWGGSGSFSKILMILQLGFSLIAMIQGITYVQNANYMRTYDLGYRTQDILSIRLQQGSNYEEFRNSIVRLSGIQKIGAAEHHLGHGNLETFVEFEDNSAQARQFNIGDTYLETMGLSIIQGRGFHEDSELDLESMVVINENLAHALGLEDPVDTRILVDEEVYYIAGVVSNFYPYGLWRDESEQLAIFKLSEKMNFIAVRTTLDLDNADRVLKSQWQEVFPDVPYESEKENIQVYRSELLSDNMASINIFMAVVALFLSSTGLFTLLSLNIRKRTKEIALRRILGATPWQIMLIVNRWFIWLVLLAILIGTILGSVLTEMFMGIMFSHYLHVGIVSIGLTSLVVLLIIGLTSGMKAYNVAQTAPVDSLQSD